MWFQLALGTPVVLWGGWPFLVRGLASLRTRNLNMFTLIAIGVGSGLGLQRLIAAIVPGIFAGLLPRADGEVAVYFEAAAVIVTLVLLGQVLELRARSSDRRRDPALLGWRRRRRAASTTTGNGGRRRPWKTCKSGRPAAGAAGREGAGRRPRRIEGASAVDESMITGEPIPSRKVRGDP